VGEAARRFAGRVETVGVHRGKFSTEREDASVAAAVARLGIVYPVVNDRDGAIWDGYAVRAWPTLLLIDGRGRVVAHHEGEIGAAALLAALARFAGPPVTTYPASDVSGPRRHVDPAPPDAPWQRGADGLLAAASPAPASNPLRFPGGVLATADALLVADSGNHRLLRLGFDGRLVAAYGRGEPGFVDGPAEQARFRDPHGLALLPDGALAVADSGNHAVRAIDLASGRVQTLAGTGERGLLPPSGGPGRETALASPWDLAWHAGALWIAMAGLHQLWRFDPVTGEGRPAAGSGAEALHDGPLPEAAFAQPSGVAALGDALYVVDAEASAVRRVDLGAGRVRRLVGRGLFVWGHADGVGGAARLQHPLAIAAGAASLWIADTYNHAIRRLDPTTRRLDTLCGGERGFVDGPLAAACFDEPAALAVAGAALWVADTNNHALRRVDLRRGVVETVTVPDGIPDDQTRKTRPRLDSVEK